MVTVTIDVRVSGDTDPSPEVVLVSVTCSEPDDALGHSDGATTNDVQGTDLGTDDREVGLRTERAGDGPVFSDNYTCAAVGSPLNAAQADHF